MKSGLVMLSCVVLRQMSLVLADEAAKANPPPFYPDKMKLMVWRDEQGAEHPVTNAQDWQRRREHILANMQLVMGPLPAPDQRVPLDVQVVQTETLPKLTRQKITYAATKNYRVPAYLLIPLLFAEP
ncbi:MAG: hypothetical protein NTY01_19115 [Verrucomicrobia bacterium]|nr:hypothetical protein [Verrucomicrobiota bacterium]